MNLKKMMMASALLMAACCMQAQTKVIAHRGFWKTPGSSQNSISSLLKADSIGCYGSEFDVWIAKDNKLVVNHDPVYKMRPMEYSKGDALTGLKLSNGENLPSLEQYLETGKNCKTQLILELKAHNNKKRETKAVQGISFIKAQVLVIAALDFLIHVHCKTHLSLCPTDSDRTFEYNAAKRRTNPFCIIYGLIIAWCVFFFKNSPDKSRQNFVQRDGYK